jgi:acetyl-CoA acyltransferase
MKMNTNDASRDPVIVAAMRTAVGKAKKGSLATVRPDDMAVAVVKEIMNRAEGLKPEDVNDLILGCAFPEGEQGLNMYRLVALRAGLPVSVPAETINRFCSSGLQSIAHAAFGIMAGQMDCVIAGGTESMTMVPMTGLKFSPNPYLAAEWPGAYLGMGLTAENVAEKYGISRADQDEFAYDSHRKANHAVQTGLFDAQIVPVQVNTVEYKKPGDISKKSFVFKRNSRSTGKIKTSIQRGRYSHRWEFITNVRRCCCSIDNVTSKSREPRT